MMTMTVTVTVTVILIAAQSAHQKYIERDIDPERKLVSLVDLGNERRNPR